MHDRYIRREEKEQGKYGLKLPKCDLKNNNNIAKKLNELQVI